MTKRIKIFESGDLEVLERRIEKGLELLNARNGTFVSLQIVDLSEPNPIIGVLVYEGKGVFDSPNVSDK